MINLVLGEEHDDSGWLAPGARGAAANARRPMGAPALRAFPPAFDSSRSQIIARWSQRSIVAMFAAMIGGNDRGASRYVWTFCSLSANDRPRLCRHRIRDPFS